MTSALSLAAAEKLNVKLKACGGKLYSDELRTLHFEKSWMKEAVGMRFHCFL